MNLLGIRAMTFDCYGTLIDWESGILTALEPWFERAGIAMQPDAVLRSFALHERAVEAGAYQSYRAVLTEVLRLFAAEYSLTIPHGRESLLAESVPRWPAFAETPSAMRAFKLRYRLAVLSNVDDDLFNAPGGSHSRLGVELDNLVTAQQVGSYKPGLAHFQEAMRRLKLEPSEILHVAESRYHDVAPARSLGMRTVWVNRHGPGGASASGSSEAIPDLEVPDLTTLTSILERESGARGGDEQT